MTVIAVLAEPPAPDSRPGLTDGPLDGEDAAALYAAALSDTLAAAARSGGDLLVNYRAPDGDDAAAEASLRSLAADALGDVSDVRFEVQVGSTFAARAGNTVTHLLEEEGATSVLVTRGDAPFLTRGVVDSTAMKLRSSPVVLGPASEGRTYFAAFTDPVDFDGAYARPSLRTLAERARDAGLDVDFAPSQPVVRSADDLRTVLPLLAARRSAERTVPTHTAAAVDRLGLDVLAENGDLRLVATDTS
jgi:glycosyltransferase A (GT-A) superfamily protein (DUF2064 family)